MSQVHARSATRPQRLDFRRLDDVLCKAREDEVPQKSARQQESVVGEAVPPSRGLQRATHVAFRKRYCDDHNETETKNYNNLLTLGQRLSKI